MCVACKKSLAGSEGEKYIIDLVWEMYASCMLMTVVGHRNYDTTLVNITATVRQAKAV